VIGGLKQSILGEFSAKNQAVSDFEDPPIGYRIVEGDINVLRVFYLQRPFLPPFFFPIPEPEARPLPWPRPSRGPVEPRLGPVLSLLGII